MPSYWIKVNRKDKLKMKFKLLKVLGKIQKLYSLPRTQERFEKYLYLLQGANKDELLLPIGGFNPMGKELAQNQLNSLIELEAENLLEKTIDQVNNETSNLVNNDIEVAINLVDDVEGSWSNYCVIDFKSKFDTSALLKRNFCTPIFYTSETFDQNDIIHRIKESLYRAVYQIEKGIPTTLSECFEQEVYVCLKSYNELTDSLLENVNQVEKYLHDNEKSTNENLIMNFFYGDERTSKLNYPSFGIAKNGGLAFVKHTANNKKFLNQRTAKT